MPPPRQQKRWGCAVFLLCAVGFFKGYRPSGRSLLEYAVTYKSITVDQFTHDIIPAITPSLVLSLLVLILITDALNYKPVIVLGSLCSVASWVVIIWFYDSVANARIREYIHGTSVAATELAYFTYMYSSIEKTDYKKVTSYTHSAVLLGKFLSGLSSHVNQIQKLLPLPDLHYVSLASAGFMLLFSLLLPKVYDHWVNPDDEIFTISAPAVGAKKNQVTYSQPTAASLAEDIAEERRRLKIQTPKDAWYMRFRNSHGQPPPKKFIQKMKETPSQSKINFMFAYSNPMVVRWSVWYALSFGLFLMVEAYIHSLWAEILGGQLKGSRGQLQTPYHGAIHASQALLSAVLALTVGCSRFTRQLNWGKWGNIVFGGGAAVQGVALLVMSQTEDLYLAYACYILFTTVFQVLQILAKSLIAESILERSEGFIFGINGLGACLIYAFLTLLLSSRYGLQVKIRDQTVIQGVYGLLLAVGLILVGIPKWRKNRDFCFKYWGRGGSSSRDELQAQSARGEARVHNID